jgi:hypothetical protein
MGRKKVTESESLDSQENVLCQKIKTVFLQWWLVDEKSVAESFEAEKSHFQHKNHILIDGES